MSGFKRQYTPARQPEELGPHWTIRHLVMNARCQCSLPTREAVHAEAVEVGGCGWSCSTRAEFTPRHNPAINVCVFIDPKPDFPNPDRVFFIVGSPFCCHIFNIVKQWKLENKKLKMSQKKLFRLVWVEKLVYR